MRQKTVAEKRAEAVVTLAKRKTENPTAQDIADARRTRKGATEMRFVKEYANYEKEKIVKADLRNEVRTNALKAIDKAVHMYDRGMITGTDAVREISYIVVDLI